MPRPIHTPSPVVHEAKATIVGDLTSKIFNNFLQIDQLVTDLQSSMSHYLEVHPLACPWETEDVVGIENTGAKESPLTNNLYTIIRHQEELANKIVALQNRLVI